MPSWPKTPSAAIYTRLFEPSPFSGREKATKLRAVLTSLQALLRLATLRRLGVFICALATLLTAASTASALEPAQKKTRVWGFDLAEHNSAGLFRAASPRTHLENRSGSAEAASGSLLAAGGASTVLGRTPAQLASKFKHAKDFGVTGNYSKANAVEFSRAIHQHVNSPGVRAIQGTYHKAPLTHYSDPSSGLNVIADPAGNFVSGWRLGAEQLKNVLAHGGL
jgi:Colicin D